MSQFKNIRRNPNRQRRVSGRTRVRPFQFMTPMGEAMMAKDLGLDEQVAKPRRESLK
jgi:hypothetical protein